MTPDVPTDPLERIQTLEHPSFQEITSWLSSADDEIGEALIKRAEEENEPHILRWVFECSIARADAQGGVIWPRPARKALGALVRRGDETGRNLPRELLLENFGGTSLKDRLGLVAQASAHNPDMLRQELGPDAGSRTSRDLYTAAVVRGSHVPDAETKARLLESAKQDARVLIAASENPELMADADIRQSVANVCLEILNGTGKFSDCQDGVELMAAVTVLRRFLDEGWQPPAEELEFWARHWRQAAQIGISSADIHPIACLLLHPAVPTSRETLRAMVRSDIAWSLDTAESMLVGDVADTWKQALEHPSLDEALHADLLQVALKATAWNERAMDQTIGDETFMHRHGAELILDKITRALHAHERHIRQTLPPLSGSNAWGIARRIAYNQHGELSSRTLREVVEKMTPEQLSQASDADRLMLAQSPDAKTRLAGILLAEQDAPPEPATARDPRRP